MVKQEITLQVEQTPEEEQLFEKLIQAWAWRNDPEMQDIDYSAHCFQVVYDGNLYTVALGTL